MLSTVSKWTWRIRRQMCVATAVTTVVFAKFFLGKYLVFFFFSPNSLMISWLLSVSSFLLSAYLFLAICLLLSWNLFSSFLPSVFVRLLQYNPFWCCCFFAISFRVSSSLQSVFAWLLYRIELLCVVFVAIRFHFVSSLQSVFVLSYSSQPVFMFCSGSPV